MEERRSGEARAYGLEQVEVLPGDAAAVRNASLAAHVQYTYDVLQIITITISSRRLLACLLACLLARLARSAVTSLQP